MVLSKIQIFSMIGVSPPQSRNAIIADFLSEGLEGLRHMTVEDVRDACASYAKRTDGPFPVILTPIQKQRVKSLVLWIKDQDRVNQPIEFPDGTNEATFRKALSDALERAERRRLQKKEGESYIDSTFNNKLKSGAQWEKWFEELDSTLGQIIGIRGVPLSYVIREKEEPHFDTTLTYEEAVIQGTVLEGPEFTQDSRTVHQVILKNIHEDSDAYTYVKPFLRKRDGRKDLEALRLRYSSEASKQSKINKAKGDLTALRYKNERNFSFEKFSAKLQKAYDDLSASGREVNNGDIVDALWPRIESSELQIYLSSLKVEYQRSPRDYKSILQDIAAEVGTKTTTQFGGRSSANVSAAYTREGRCPNSGVHTPDGSIFIGSYDREKWQDETVKQYHHKIIEARDKGEAGYVKKSRSNKRKVNAIKRNKKQLEKLQAQIAAAKIQIKKVTFGQDLASDIDTPNNQAGNAFGGKNSKRKLNHNK